MEVFVEVAFFRRNIAEMEHSNGKNEQIPEAELYKKSQDAQEDDHIQQDQNQLPNPSANEAKCREIITLDRIYSEIGEFGLYHKLHGLIMGITFAFGSITILIFLFGSAIPDHRYSQTLQFRENS